MINNQIQRNSTRHFQIQRLTLTTITRKKNKKYTIIIIIIIPTIASEFSEDSNIYRPI